MDVIKINLRLNQDYDPLPILSELKEKYQGPNHLNETILQEGTYYLIVKHDMDQALDLIMSIIKSNPTLHSLSVSFPGPSLNSPCFEYFSKHKYVFCTIYTDLFKSTLFLGIILGSRI